MYARIQKYDINYEQDNLPLWNVVLTGDFAVITANVFARDEQDAEILARNFLVDYYDMNLDSFHTEASKHLCYVKRPKPEKESK